ncbi:hypothetical protein MBLNU459_g2538t1 [Dothideomycetes sp. NU459]
MPVQMYRSSCPANGTFYQENLALGGSEEACSTLLIRDYIDVALLRHHETSTSGESCRFSNTVRPSHARPTCTPATLATSLSSKWSAIDMPTLPLLPPNPSLLALILTIRTRSGPRFVFHYPSVPEPSQTTTTWHFGSAGSDSESSGESSSDTEADGDEDEDDSTSTSGAVRPGSITEDGRSSRHAGTVKTGLTGVSGSTRRTARTLREDGPEDEDADEDIEPLDLGEGSATERLRGESKAGADEEEDAEGRQCAEAEWEKVLGYPTEGLEKMLSPPRSMRKKRFEVLVEDVVFLGYPLFARDDGFWKKRKKAKGGQASAETQYAAYDDVYGESDVQDDEELPQNGETPMLGSTVPHHALLESPPISPTDTRMKINQSNRNINQALSPVPGPISQSYRSQGGVSVAHSEAKSVSTASGSANGDEMSMFHVVFVMDPPTLEYHIRVQEMFDNVVKKFAKALKYEQARSGYVWKEAQKIQALKAQAKENKTPMSILWHKIINESVLAKSIANVYTSIASSKIAHVSIASRFDASLQIPQAISTPYVPTATEPQLPGLWLTTASMFEDDEVGGTLLSPHAALLLLEDKETLLKEIEGDNKELASPLAYFIRELTPTKSLQKLSSTLSIPLTDMQFLARHLIYWRRARAVPPLHIRDTYIVSPNSDMRGLPAATSLYSARFSALPSLPKMLQSLSSKPIQYGYLIPSKDHKAAYMDILAWLLRGGWVTQLRSFAWIKVSPAVKVQVAIAMRRESEEKRAKKVLLPPTLTNQSSSEDSGNGNSHLRGKNASSESLPNFTPRRGWSEDENSSAVSPRLVGLLSPSRAPSDAGSVSSGRTAIPLLPATMSSPALKPSPLGSTVDALPASVSAAAVPSPRNSIVSTSSASQHAASLSSNEPVSVSGASASASASTPLPPIDESAYETSLVLSPHRANEVETRWLAYIADELVRDQDVRDNWALLRAYFDGRRALEDIAAREGVKRAKVAGWIAHLERIGVLVLVRHW